MEYNWTTHFDHIEDTMTHIFSKQVKVVVSWKDNQYYITRNGTTIEKGDLKMSIVEFEKMLVKTAKAAVVLELLTA